jgi:hypothetical protein
VYRFANFFTLGILKESKEGRAGVFCIFFWAYFIFLELLTGNALFNGRPLNFNA